ncbi:MAG: hypothetical protein J3Q66DRAFT_343868 [Benniella sp.]|nr:MAG: hypothetical protein J3Q66DRAFT_343868 [Benniella sp.]
MANQLQPTLYTLLLRRVEALEEERQVLRTQYGLMGDRSQNNNNNNGGHKDGEDNTRGSSSNTTNSTQCPLISNNILLSQLWLQAGQSTERFQELLLLHEQDHAQRIEAMVQTIVQMTSTVEQQIQLAQIQKDKEIRLAEINGKIRLKELDHELKLKLAQMEKEERVRMAEITESENVRLAQIAKEEKIRQKELEKDTMEAQQEGKAKLKEMCVEESNRHRELQWEELRRKVELQQDVLPKIMAVEAETKRAQIQSDNMMAILQHVEKMTLGNPSRDDSSSKSNLLKTATLLSTPTMSNTTLGKDDIVTGMDTALSLIKEITAMFDRECTLTTAPDSVK